MRQRRDPEMLELSNPVQGELPLGPLARGAAPAAAPKPRPPSAAEQLPAPWLTFLKSLTDVLRALEDGHRLILLGRRDRHFVNISAHGAVGFTAQTDRGKEAERSPRQRATDIARLARLGWGQLPLDRNARNGVSRVGDHLREWAHPAPLAEVALLAVRTLREVWGVAHPRDLVYSATDSFQRDVLLPTLRLNRRPLRQDPTETARALHPASRQELQEAVLSALREHTGIPDLGAGTAGSVALSRRAISVIVLVSPGSLLVEILATIASDTEATPELLAVLHDATAASQSASFFVRRGTVYANATIGGAVFVPELLTSALDRLMDNAERVQKTLRERFPGAMFFNDDFAWPDSPGYSVN